jgi:hypothetical protein
MDVKNRYGSSTGKLEQSRINKLRITVLMLELPGCTSMVPQVKNIRSSNTKRDNSETSMIREY